VTTRRKGYALKRVKKNGAVTWWARVTYIDPTTGKRRDLQRRAQSKAHATQKCNEIIRQIDDSEGRAIDHEKKTFADLASLYEGTYAVPAIYSGDEKIGGLRDHVTVKGQLAMLKAHFGAIRLRALGYSEIRAFRMHVFEMPTRVGRKRSVANVNRIMALLRRMLNVAVEERWLNTNPFKAGRSLIEASKETKRERVLSLEEEARLLHACRDSRRAHLRPIIICALETGMRCGEILKLRWSDVDLDAEIISVQKLNTKTLRRRSVGIPPRLLRELATMKRNAVEPEGAIFGISTIKTAFETARSLAVLPGVRFHDLRHTAASRLVQGGMSIAEVARILGHSNIATTFRYVNADAGTLQRQVEIFAEFSVQGQGNDSDSQVAAN
jgi:integrase